MTPVGDDCHECGEPISEHDQGSFIYAASGPEPVHKECSLRAVLGGIGHHEDHQRFCVEQRDPDMGLGFRASALAVWALVHRYDVV